MKNGKKSKRVLAALMACVIAAALIIQCGAEPPYEGYLYNMEGKAVGAPVPYSLETLIDSTYLGTGKISNLKDMVIYQNNIYLLDSGNDTGAKPSILIISTNNGQYKLVKRISQFFGINGKPESLFIPEGIEIYPIHHDDGTTTFDLIVCDTGNNRIVRMDTNGHFTKVYKAPDLSILKKTEDITYMPSKVTLDKSNRIYVVAKSTNYGLISLDSDGGLISFFGAPEVTADPFTKFWRRIVSAAGAANLTEYTPTEYSNVVTDQRGFIYGTIAAMDEGDLAATFYTAPGADARYKAANVRLLNAGGVDIMKRLGINPNVGDLVITKDQSGSQNSSRLLEKTSSFVDVALSNNGIYSCLDSTYGRVFTYDEDGNLLFIFGGGGAIVESLQKGTIRNPVAIGYLGQKILVVDGAYSTISVFAPTDYGKTVLNAAGLYYNGEYGKSEKVWLNVIKRNSNMYYAYVGTGKALMRSGNYAEAMKDFKLVESRTYYSKALKEYLKQTVGNTFSIAFILIVAAVVIFNVIRSVKKFKKFINDGAKKVM